MEQGYELILMSIKEAALSQANNNQIYIPLQGKHTTGLAEEPFDLAEKIKQFFVFDEKNTSDPYVMLLMGDTGSGKSVFAQRQYQQLWEDYKAGDPISLWVPLPELENPFEEAVEEVLRKYGFNEVQISELKAREKFTFIVDGYDELHQFQNCYVTNKWNQWNAKVLITCRSEALYYQKDPDKYFVPFNGEKRIPSLLRRLYVAQFSEDQISVYVAQYQKVNKENKLSEADFAKIPGLVELIATPFLLHLALEALPDILAAQIDDQKITQAKLYDVFFDHWFNRQVKKLCHSGLLYDSEGNAKHKLWDYCKRLAQKMHEYEVSVILYQGKKVGERLFGKQEKDNIWKSFFNEDTEVLRSACPLKRVGEHYYGFIHASLVEYFATRLMYEEIDSSVKVSEKVDVEKGKEERVTTSEVVRFQKLKGGIHQRIFTRERHAIRFIADRIEQSEKFKKKMLAIVEASKRNDEYTIGAANAITSLVRAGVAFNGADLRRIKIVGADISGGYFDSVDFSESDLSEVSFTRCWLREARIVRCQLDSAHFGEYPNFEHKDVVRSIDYRPDLNRLVVASGDSVYLWDIMSGKCIQEFKGHERAVLCVALSDDAQSIASGSYDNTVRIWNIKSSQFEVLRGHEGGVSSVCFSRDGLTVVSGSWDSTVRVWNVAKGLSVVLRGHKDWVESVHMSDDGQIVASGGQDETVRIWNIMNGEAIVLHRHNGRVKSVHLSGDGKIVVSGGYDKMVRVWDIASEDAVVLWGHTEQVNSVYLSSDKQTVVSGCDDGWVLVWNVSSGQAAIFQGHTGRIVSVNLSNDGRTVASGGSNQVRVWDVDSGNTEILGGHEAKVTSVYMSSDGQTIASGSDDKTVRVWKVEGKQLQKLRKYEEKITSVCLNNDGRTVVSGSLDHGVYVSDVMRDQLQILRGHEGSVNSVALSSDGRIAVSGSEDKTVRVWDVASGQAIVLRGHEEWVSSVVLSNDGRIAVSGSEDKTVRLWDITSGQVVVLQHEKYVTVVAVSSDGRMVVSGSADGTIRVWDVSNRCAILLHGHAGLVKSLYLYSDKKKIISSASDGTVRIWDVILKSQINVIHFNNQVNSLSVHEASNRMIVGLQDSSVQLWNCFDQQGERWQLNWSSNYRSLSLHVADCDLSGSEGLSSHNEQMLIQRGVINSIDGCKKESHVVEEVSEEIQISKQNAVSSVKPVEPVMNNAIANKQEENKKESKGLKKFGVIFNKKKSSSILEEQSEASKGTKKGKLNKLKIMNFRSKDDHHKPEKDEDRADDSKPGPFRGGK